MNAPVEISSMQVKYTRILSCIWGSVTDNNGFWIGWLDFTILSFFSCRCPLVNIPQLNTDLSYFIKTRWTLLRALSYNSGRTDERPLPPTVRVLLCFIRYHEMFANPVATLWLLRAYPLLRNVLIEPLPRNGLFRVYSFPGNVLTEPLPGNGLFRLSGVMSLWSRVTVTKDGVRIGNWIY
jgi:hypothetical protein